MRRTTLLILSLALAGCGNGSASPDAGPDQGPGQPDAAPLVPPGFERWCSGKNPALRTPLTLDKLAGKYVGAYQTGVTASGKVVPIQTGTLELMKVVAPAPFLVEKIRVAFASGSGKARLRLEHTFGRSYPASFPAHDPEQPVSAFPNYDPKAVDVVPAKVIDVKNAKPDTWVEVDVSAARAALLPTQHYAIIYEHLQSAPYLAIEEMPSGSYSRALMIFPDQAAAYGVSIDSKGTGGNYRLQLVGKTFCEWSTADRWFEDTTPLGSTTVGASEIVDINGDGHDDLVVTIPQTGDGPQPRVYFGDGKGAFSAASFDALALARGSGMLAFADFDNDGDQDVFATVYVYPDQDGDDTVVQTVASWASAVGDCNDLDATIYPGAQETANGKDDDCDGKADEGTSGATSASDSDADGHSVAAGDCDDTQSTVYPGATERLDGRDNDCDGKADESFHHMLLLNTTATCAASSGNCPNGDGHYVLVASSGLELSEPASAVGLGDANGDGLLDLYWGSWLIHYPSSPAAASHFFVGNPACLTDSSKCGTFVDSMSSAGMSISSWKPVYGVTFNDFNNDGHQDIYVGNYQLNDNLMWKNGGSGTFTEAAAQHHLDHDSVASPYSQYPGGHSYNSEFGDIDNDGDMDLFLCNLSHPRTQPWADPSQLYINQGAPGFDFVDRRHAQGILYDEGDLNAAFGDFDNDMDLDLAIAGVYPGHYTRLYRNDGGKFTDVTYESGAQIHQSGTVGWADVNEDGALDLKLHGSDSPQLHLFLNRIGKKNNWVELVLQGTKTNRDAVGARVTLKAGAVAQLRDVRGSSGGGISANQSSRVVHFGLGQNKSVASVTVRWVGGKTETVSGVGVNGLYRIVEGSGTAVKVR